MIETTETTVATPMMTPRSVRKDRSLLRRKACRATAKTSPKGMSARGAGGLRSLLFLLDFHLVPLLQRPQRLEGTGHDLLAGSEPAGDLDFQFAGQPELDRKKPRLPFPKNVDPRFRLDPPGGGLLPFWRVAHDDRRERDRQNARLGSRDDVRGDREARADPLGRADQLDPHLEVDRVGCRDQPLQLGVRAGDRRVLDLRDQSLEYPVWICLDRENRLLSDLDVGDIRLVDHQHGLDGRHVGDRHQLGPRVVHRTDDGDLAFLDRQVGHDAIDRRPHGRLGERVAGRVQVGPVLLHAPLGHLEVGLCGLERRPRPLVLGFRQDVRLVVPPGPIRSIWSRKSLFLTASPSRTARFTIWPMTSADSSTFFSAWIFPLAVTLETMSSGSARAVVTRGMRRSRAETHAKTSRRATTAPAIKTIFHVFDIASFR